MASGEDVAQMSDDKHGLNPLFEPDGNQEPEESPDTSEAEALAQLDADILEAHKWCLSHNVNISHKNDKVSMSCKIDSGTLTVSETTFIKAYRTLKSRFTVNQDAYDRVMNIVSEIAKEGSVTKYRMMEILGRVTYLYKYNKVEWTGRKN